MFLDRLLQSRPGPLGSFRDAAPLVAAVWALMGVYDVAVIEMMRPYVETPAFVVDPTLVRFVNHLLMTPLALFAAATLLALVRNGLRWFEIAPLVVAFGLAVGVIERASMVFLVAAVAQLPQALTLQEILGGEHRSELTYSARAALKHAEAFVVTALVMLARHHLQRLVAAERERNQAIESDLRSRLAALQNELSPHFMFNALHHAVARAADPATRAIVVDLGELLRYVLRGRTEPMTTVGEEIEFSRAYLALCEAQGTAVRATWSSAESVAGATVPRLLLHMLVENAYRHAGELGPQGEIRVQVERAGDRLVVETLNDFVPGTTIRGTGVGLSNIRERLAILYRDGYRMDAGATQPGRWRTRVELPS